MSKRRVDDCVSWTAFCSRCSVLLLIIVNVIEAYGGNNGVLFPQHEKTRGYRLRNHVVRKVAAASIIECALHCLPQDRCTSINYKKTPPSKVQDNCELNNATASISDKPEDLIKEASFFHYELFNPEKVVNFYCTTPCQNGGACDLESGQCKCAAGFVGKTCGSTIGSVKEFPGKSCNEIKSYHVNSTSGTYWIKPQISPQNASWDSTSQDALQVFCDMETYGGGWTLVYSYTFTNYDNFYNPNNAVTPRPNWPVSLTSVPISKTVPLSEKTLGAMDYELWRYTGEIFMVKSNVNDWIICRPNGGSLVTKQDGMISCQNIKNVAPACKGLVPTFIKWGLCGPRITINSYTSFFHFDVATRLCYPSHNPCNKLTKLDIDMDLSDPGGSVFLR